MNGDAAVVPSVRGQPGASVSVRWRTTLGTSRRLCLPKAVKHWSLRSVQVKLIKTVEAVWCSTPGG